MKAVVVRAQNEVGFDDVAAPGPCGETDVRVRMPAIDDGGCSVITVIFDPRSQKVEEAACNGVA
jgi:hypothetical protein